MINNIYENVIEHDTPKDSVSPTSVSATWMTTAPNLRSVKVSAAGVTHVSSIHTSFKGSVSRDFGPPLMIRTHLGP